MRPARALLIGPLENRFHGKDRSESFRTLVASIVASFAADQPDTLTRLLLDADERQFPVIFRALGGYKDVLVPRLTDLVSTTASPAASRPEKAAFARRQANAAIALLRFGSADPLWPLLKASEDPQTRCLLIDRLAPLESPHALLTDRSRREQDRAVRAAILLGLEQFTIDGINASQRSELVPLVLALFTDDPDPAVHSAAGSLLKTWGLRQQVRSAEIALASSRPLGAHRWYVGPDGLTMALLAGKQGFNRGSAPDEQGRKNNEDQRTVDIAPFEIATTEVTIGQFTLFLDQVDGLKEHYPAQAGASPDFPKTHVTWYEATYYCNWRSQREGIPKDEWCYEPNADGQYGPGMKIAAAFQSKTGYRLPTEAEWEYACRAGTVTSRCFGDSDELLDRYACCLKNSQDRPVPTGSFHAQCVRPL